MSLLETFKRDPNPDLINVLHDWCEDNKPEIALQIRLFKFDTNKFHNHILSQEITNLDKLSPVQYVKLWNIITDELKHKFKVFSTTEQLPLYDILVYGKESYYYSFLIYQELEYTKNKEFWVLKEMNDQDGMKLHKRFNKNANRKRS